MSWENILHILFLGWMGISLFLHIYWAFNPDNQRASDEEGNILKMIIFLGALIGIGMFSMLGFKAILGPYTSDYAGVLGVLTALTIAILLDKVQKLVRENRLLKEIQGYKSR